MLVGPDEQRFDLHKGLLCSISDFFNTALTGTFIEANGTIKLPEQSPATFKYFVYWLYTRSLKGFYYPRTIKPTMFDLALACEAVMTEKGFDNLDELSPDDPHRKAWELASYQDAPFESLIALYILGDALQIRKLGDHVVSTLIHVYSHNTTAPAKRSGYKSYWTSARPQKLVAPVIGINMAYDALPQTCCLRALLVTLFCDSTSDIGYHCSHGQRLHPDFVVAVGEEFADRWLTNKQSTAWGEASEHCRYHVHKGASCTLVEVYLDTGLYSSLD